MSISRRRLLSGFGGFVALLIAGAVGVNRLPLPATRAETEKKKKEKTDRQWGMVVDLRRCDGCKECTGACQTTHYLTNDQEWIKVYEVESENGGTVFMPRLCMQCEEAPCLKVCPVRATFKNDEGVILIDQELCIGCRICMAACPYNARYFNWWDAPKPPGPFDNPMPEFPVPQQRGTVGKCVFCVHYTSMGRLPACVEACRMDALYIADLNSGVMTNRSGETYQLQQYLEENDAFRFKEELNTSPRVWYVAGHGQALDHKNEG
jgi:molybdopterin-containing oxidoreductase family iron-sulfur binding subunit